MLEVTDELHLDLRAPVDPDVADRLADLGLGAAFAVLTGQNPHGDHAEDLPEPARRERRARDRRRDARLAAELDRAGHRFRWLVARSVDGRHREHCVAFTAARAEAEAIARRFDQAAFFYFEGGRFLLCPAEAGGAPRVLPLAAHIR